MESIMSLKRVARELPAFAFIVLALFACRIRRAGEKGEFIPSEDGTVPPLAGRLVSPATLYSPEEEGFDGFTLKVSDRVKTKQAAFSQLREYGALNERKGGIELTGFGETLYHFHRTKQHYLVDSQLAVLYKLHSVHNDIANSRSALLRGLNFFHTKKEYNQAIDSLLQDNLIALSSDMRGAEIWITPNGYHTIKAISYDHLSEIADRYGYLCDRQEIFACENCGSGYDQANDISPDNLCANCESLKADRELPTEFNLPTECEEGIEETLLKQAKDQSTSVLATCKSQGCNNVVNTVCGYVYCYSCATKQGSEETNIPPSEGKGETLLGSSQGSEDETETKSVDYETQHGICEEEGCNNRLPAFRDKGSTLCPNCLWERMQTFTCCECEESIDLALVSPDSDFCQDCFDRISN